MSSVLYSTVPEDTGAKQGSAPPNAGAPDTQSGSGDVARTGVTHGAGWPADAPGRPPVERQLLLVLLYSAANNSLTASRSSMVSTLMWATNAAPSLAHEKPAILMPASPIALVSFAATPGSSRPCTRTE